MSRLPHLFAMAIASDLARGDRFAPWVRIVPAWPADQAVPLPLMRGRCRDAPEGTEEGELCFRNGGCQGKLELRSRDGAGCHCGISWAPCSSCMSRVPECPSCGHREPEPD